ncbi:5067_t:CDS:2 [Ambispora gerdemannii]|uniref:5060_t:CDS:1 n=1 Tax=Ambispora gerdemannii TaxID=144530 RepID=A0A9N9BBZ6_9GLOM|nr:5060_t:CDS:2 [Ambispora gerdemannii]CAG8558624.1 5067_t:CDS:2 [Ambispora gerdemannii]
MAVVIKPHRLKLNLLPSLGLNPLSVAKFFYERGIETNSTMQDLLYLSYLEGTYQGLFDKYPNIINKQVSQHLENIYQQYKKHEERKRELTFAEKAKDRAWKITQLVPKTFFDFSEMIIGCLHQDGFTNTVKRNQFKAILAELLTALELFSTHDFEEKAAEIDNCHQVKAEYMKTRIGELLG